MEKKDWPQPALRLEALEGEHTLSLNKLKLTLMSSPLKIHIATNEGKTVQRLTIDEQTGAVDFEREQRSVLGLGGGGALV